MQTAFFADGLRAQRGELLGDLLLLLARALAVQLNLPVLQHLLPVEVRLLLAEPLDVLQHALALRVRLGVEGALLPRRASRAQHAGHARRPVRVGGRY